MGWIRRGVPSVVTADHLDEDHEGLVIENQQLRCELARVKATQELQSFTFKLFGLQIQYRRLPFADSKEMLLSAIAGASKIIGLSVALHAIGLSAARFRAWLKRQRGCELDDQSSCPRGTPTKLTEKERMTIRRYATDPKLAHLSTSALSLLAKRKGELYASATTWCRLVREHRLRPLLRRIYPAAFSNSMIEAFFRRLKHAWLFVHPLPSFDAVTMLTEQYIHDHNELIPHSALGGATPAEVFHGNWSQVDRDKIEAQGRAARNARMLANRESGCRRCDQTLVAIALP